MVLRKKMFSSLTFLNSANYFIVFNYAKCRKHSVKVLARQFMVKDLSAKTDDLSLISRTHMVEQ